MDPDDNSIEDDIEFSNYNLFWILINNLQT